MNNWYSCSIIMIQSKTAQKLTHQEAVEHIQAAMSGGVTLAEVETAQPASSMSVSKLIQSNNSTNTFTSQPIPPELDALETTKDEGFYVDDTDFELAQSRVKRWLELDAEISTLNTALRTRRREKEDLNKHLLAFMQSNHIPHFEMSKGNLTMAVSKHKQPLNQKFITEKIHAVDGLSDNAKQTLIKSIFEDRSVTEKTRLKHTRAK